MKNTITGYTGLYGIIAKPIKHSFSPMMHNTAFQKLKMDNVYLAFEIEEEQLQSFIKAVPVLPIKGFNVSMPYKVKIMEYLDALTPEASMCKAVNTVANREGKLIGHITDGIGFVLSCKEKGWNVKNQKIVVMGAGGAATAIIVQLALEGAKEIIVYNRSEKPHIEELNEQLSCTIVLKKLEDKDSLKNDLQDSYLLINTTNVGMEPNTDECIISDSSYLSNTLKVADIIYHPKMTRLLQMAKEKGLEYCNGEGMIVYQGAESFRFWTNENMPIKEVKEALEME